MDPAASTHLPLILIEVVLVFGGVLAFGWWQIRSTRRDREQAAARRTAQGTDLASTTAIAAPTAAAAAAAATPVRPGRPSSRPASDTADV